MSDVLERFLRFVQVDSQSDPSNDGVVPSAPCEHEMARVLGEELRSLGCEDVRVDEHAYVTASVPASPGAEDLPALGLIAHLDTSPDAPASGVRPRVVRYDGNPILLGIIDGQEITISPDDVPDLEHFYDEDIVVTDGNTLLGADDKAGIAEICSLLHRIQENPELPHPALKIAFVPDEEIGHGAALLDLDAFGATWAYTVDGGAMGEVDSETFNASETEVVVRGVMVHPGSAKNVMVNAITVAGEFERLVPAFERPEHTEGREGFYHPTSVSGTASDLRLTYILRDFEAEGLAKREETLRQIAAFLNERYGAGTVEVSFKKEYRNMADGLGDSAFLIEAALTANMLARVDSFHEVSVRGGTDGAQLTFRGLPCPNLATGTYNMHSVREFIPVRSLEESVDVLEKLVGLFAVPLDAQESE